MRGFLWKEYRLAWLWMGQARAYQNHVVGEEIDSPHMHQAAQTSSTAPDHCLE